MRKILRIHLKNCDINLTTTGYMELLEKRAEILHKKLIDEDDEELRHILWNFEVYDNSKDLKTVLEEAGKVNLIAEITGFRMLYSKKDFDNVDFFVLFLRNFGKRDYTEPYNSVYENIHDCDSCRTYTTKLVSDLYIDKSLFNGKDIAVTSDYDIVISQKLHDIFVKNNVEGVQYNEVKHKNNRMKDEPIVYNMIIDNVLPKASYKLTFFRGNDYCPICDAGNKIPTSLFIYKKDDFKHFKDFNYTYEWVGGAYFKSKEIIISRKVYNLLTENKIKWTKFDIVEVDND